MPRLFYYILAVLIGWAVFFGLNSTQEVLSGAFGWEPAIRLTLYQWLPWMLVSPLIFWLTLRFPIDWHRWWLRLAVHLAAGAMAMVFCAWLSDRLFAPPAPVFFDGSRGFPGEQRSQPFESDPVPPPDEPPQDFHWQGPPPFWVRARFNIPIYLTFVSLSHTLIFFRRAQQRGRRTLELEAQLGAARLQALRIQLHPHFLFNTLNAIATLVHTNPRAADEMIGSLSGMLRQSLDTVAEQEVPLSRELRYCDCYLEIEQIRFGDRLEVKRNITPETQAALVPTFILQPLVENAIRHGIERSLGPGTIELGAKRDGGVLRLSIRDSGAGLAHAAGGAAPGQDGVGLSNTRARMQNLYPGQNRLVLRNAPEGGCLAELEIPFHTETRPVAGPPTPP